MSSPPLPKDWQRLAAMSVAGKLGELPATGLALISRGKKAWTARKRSFGFASLETATGCVEPGAIAGTES